VVNQAAVIRVCVSVVPWRTGYQLTEPFSRNGS
jgi:hypothetical protein